MKMKDIDHIQNIGSRVEELRLLHQERRTTLAAVIGVSYSYLCKLLKDQYKWSEEKVYAVAEHYDVDYEYLYYGIQTNTDVNDNSFYINKDITDIYSCIRKMPQEQRRKFGKKLILEILDILLIETP